MRIFLIALAVLYWAGASFATSIVMKPAKCPADANMTPLAAGDAAAPDLNQWRQAVDQVNPVVDITIAEPPQANRIFARFRADPETGETLSRHENVCGE